MIVAFSKMALKRDVSMLEKLCIGFEAVVEFRMICHTPVMGRKSFNFTSSHFPPGGRVARQRKVSGQVT
jgi:hypothetical protein